MTRLLNKWQDEGILEYISGKGRGYSSEIIFNVPIESEFINYLIRNIDHYEIHQLQRIMEMPMGETSRRALRFCIDERLFGDYDTDIRPIRHVDYLLSIPDVLDPLGTMDLSVAAVLANVADRLYFTIDNDIRSWLILYDEWEENNLIIHLHRHIRFSNGDVLNADDVIRCLKRLIEMKQHIVPFPDIVAVEKLDTFKLKIVMTERIELVKLLLSFEFASIYKKHGDEFIFTGPYKIQSLDSEAVKLEYNPYYHSSRPDITHILLLSDQVQYDKYVQKYNLAVKPSENYQILDFALVNPAADLSRVQRLKLKEMLTGSTLEKCEQPLFQDISIAIVNDAGADFTSLIDNIEKYVERIMVTKLTLKSIYENGLPKTDLIFMREQFPLNRLAHSLFIGTRFADWFESLPESQRLLYIYRNKHMAYWQYAEKQYERFLKEELWLIELDKYKKEFYFPSHYENIKTNAYGIIQYGGVSVLNEVQINDR